MALTPIQIQTLIDTNLADASNIAPNRHREVEYEILNLIKSIMPLAKGTFVLGDLTTTDGIIQINFPNIGTSDYMAAVYPVSKSANFSLDNDVFLSTREHTSTSFKVCLREVTNNVQNLEIDWELRPKN